MLYLGIVKVLSLFYFVFLSQVSISLGTYKIILKSEKKKKVTAIMLRNEDATRMGKSMKKTLENGFTSRIFHDN